jgi:nucleosome binding factor SPN SPT16 subunit
LDAVLLHTGTATPLQPEIQNPKTIAMFEWLFGYEFTETVIVLQKGGKVILWTNNQKLKYFQGFKGPDFHLVPRVRRASVESDASQFKEVMDLLRTGGESIVTVGIPYTETGEGPMAQVVADVLPTLPGFKVKDCREGISRLLAKKDGPGEVNTIKSSQLVQALMKKFIDAVETIIDDADKAQVRVTNADVCS